MSKQSPTEGGSKKTLWSAAITKAFPNYADLIERAVLEDLRRYQRFSKWHMIWFRVTGFLEILLSVSFPFVISFMNTQYPNYNNTVLFTGISIGIALSAGISAFYSWKDNWKLFSAQQLAVSLVVRRWELALLPLIHDPEGNSQEALDVTVTAVEDIERVLQHEQDTYFGGVKLPEDILRKKGDTKSKGDKPIPLAAENGRNLRPTHWTTQSSEVDERREANHKSI